MKHSESIANLAAALIGAQAEIKTIGFDSVNPFFKSKYASLTTILETVRPILARHKLAVVQGASTPHTDHNGQLTAVSVESTLIHASGEWLTSGVIMPVGVTPIEKGSDVRLPTAQNAGAAVSFGRRYALAALLSLATDEDVDGNDTAPAPTHRTAAAPIANRAPSPVARPTAQPNGGALMPFGKTKGTPLAQLKDAEIESALAWAREKGKFEEFQRDATAELAARQSDESEPIYTGGPDDSDLPF